MNTTKSIFPTDPEWDWKLFKIDCLSQTYQQLKDAMKPNGKAQSFCLARAVAVTLDLLIFILGESAFSIDKSHVAHANNSNNCVNFFLTFISGRHVSFYRILRWEHKTRLLLSRSIDQLQTAEGYNFHQNHHRLWPHTDHCGELDRVSHCFVQKKKIRRENGT